MLLQTMECVYHHSTAPLTLSGVYFSISIPSFCFLILRPNLFPTLLAQWNQQALCCPLWSSNVLQCGPCIFFSKIFLLASLKHSLLFFLSCCRHLLSDSQWMIFLLLSFHSVINRTQVWPCPFPLLLMNPAYLIKMCADCLTAYFNHLHSGYELTLEAVSITESNKVHQQPIFDFSPFQNTSLLLSATWHSFHKRF